MPEDTSEQRLQGSSYTLKIDFKPDEENPARVFRTMDKMISALDQFDDVLSNTLDLQIETVSTLEKVEAGSVKAFIGKHLKRIDGDSLREGRFKPVIGRYLAEGRDDLLRWCENDGKEKGGEALLELQSKLIDRAEHTNLKHLPAYRKPSAVSLAACITAVSEAKSHLTPEDSITYHSELGDIQVDQLVVWLEEDFESVLTKEEQEWPSTEMILIVKKADFLGESMWEFRYNKRKISARITDQNWIDKFHAREVDLRPGDALRCRVSVYIRYGHDNEVISEIHTVTEVIEVLPNRETQALLLE